MSIMRTIGRLGATKVSGNTELIAGVIEGIDPAVMGGIVNQNTDFLMDVIAEVDIAALLRGIDPAILKGVIDEALDIIAEDVTLLDLDKVVTIVNNLDYKRTGEMLTKIDPNILGIALGVMLYSFRNASVTPGIFVADESIENIDIRPTVSPKEG